MKKNKILVIAILVGAQIISLNGFSQNVGINTTGVNPAASAMLDIVSSNKGLLVPRVSLTSTSLAGPISSPATSLLVYNNASAGGGSTAVTPGYYFWDGSKWERFKTGASSSSGWDILGNTSTNDAVNFIGTTDAQDLVFKTNNSERIRIESTGFVGFGTNTPSKLFDFIGDDGSTEDFVLQDEGTGTYSYLHMVIRNETGSGEMSYSFSKQSGNSHFAGVDFDPDNDEMTIRNNARAGGNSGAYDGFITFVTSDGSSQERMRIANDGKVGVGVTSLKTQFHVLGGIGLGDNGGGLSTTHGTKNSIQLNTDTYYGGVHNEHSGALIYAANMNGWTTAKLDICISNNWGTYNTGSPAMRIGQTSVLVHGVTVTSDKRLKTNVKSLEYGLDNLMKLKPVSYIKHTATNIDNGNISLDPNGELRIGFIAQEVYEIIPEIVFKPENSDTDFWGLDYSKLSVLAIKSIQELNQKIILLEEENKQVKSRLDEMDVLKAEIEMLKKSTTLYLKQSD